MSYNKLLNFAIGSYLMLRIDYVVICRDELEAKILRIIEMYMDMERARLYQEAVNAGTIETDEVIEVTKDIWIAISHKLFTRDLYQLVKSENTLKRAIKSLIDKGFLLVRPGQGKYDPMYYQLNTAKLQEELNKLAQLGIVGYQKLIPSKFDTPQGSKNRHPQSLIPSKIDPHSRIVSSRRINGGSRNEKEEKGDTGASLDAMTPPAPAFPANVTLLSDSAKLRALKAVAPVPHARIAHDELPPDIEDWDESTASTARVQAVRVTAKGNTDAALAHRPGAPADVAPTAPADTPGALDIRPLAEETPVGAALESATEIRATPVASGATSSASSFPATRSRPPGAKTRGAAPVPQAAPPIPDAALAILDAWDSLFKAPCVRTDKHVAAATALIACHPTKDDLKKCKDWLFTTDNPQKPWYRKRGVKLTDIAENYGAWQSVQPHADESSESEEGDPYSFASILKRQAQQAASA